MGGGFSAGKSAEAPGNNPWEVNGVGTLNKGAVRLAMNQTCHCPDTRHIRCERTTTRRRGKACTPGCNTTGCTGSSRRAPATVTANHSNVAWQILFLSGSSSTAGAFGWNLPQSSPGGRQNGEGLSFGVRQPDLLIRCGSCITQEMNLKDHRTANSQIECSLWSAGIPSSWLRCNRIGWKRDALARVSLHIPPSQMHHACSCLQPAIALQSQKRPELSTGTTRHAKESSLHDTGETRPSQAPASESP